MKTENKYPIKAVSSKTGLSMHVIRAWEKRYNAVVPERTETNRRLYSTKDILKLQLLSKAIELGHNIGNIANSSIPELKRLIEEDASAPQPVSDKEEVNTNAIVDSFITQIRSMDVKSLEMILQKAAISMSRPVLIEKVIVPIIEKIGNNWRDGSIRIYHEHIATVVLRSFLSTLTNALEYDLNAPNLIVTTLKGHIHELGAMIVAATAAAEGWKSTYLGPNLPVEEIAAIAESIDAKVVCISIVYPFGDPAIMQELEKLAQFLPDSVSLLVGGRAAASYSKSLTKINSHLISDIQGLRNHLQSLENQLLNV